MEPFDFKAFWQGLTLEEKKELAREAGTTVGYIRTHLVYRRRVPSRKLMIEMYKACVHKDPSITKENLVTYFYSAA